MARMTTASCRLCRREGEKLFLKGSKCGTAKCTLAKRETQPGQHGAARKKKISNYAVQLREKQKAKRIYGILERQFRNYFKKAESSKGVTGLVLLQLLERRLDNVVFRACFAESRARARQIVSHRFIKVNGRTINIASYSVKLGDEISVFGPDERLKNFRENVKLLEGRGKPDWLEVSPEKLTIKITRLPEKKDSGLAIEERRIIELYSK